MNINKEFREQVKQKHPNIHNKYRNGAMSISKYLDAVYYYSQQNKFSHSELMQYYIPPNPKIDWGKGGVADEQY